MPTFVFFLFWSQPALKSTLKQAFFKKTGLRPEHQWIKINCQILPHTFHSEQYWHIYLKHICTIYVIWSYGCHVPKQKKAGKGVMEHLPSRHRPHWSLQSYLYLVFTVHFDLSFLYPTVHHPAHPSYIFSSFSTSWNVPYPGSWQPCSGFRRFP